jgi:hypothetical protein
MCCGLNDMLNVTIPPRLVNRLTVMPDEISARFFALVREFPSIFACDGAVFIMKAGWLHRIFLAHLKQLEHAHLPLTASTAAWLIAFLVCSGCCSTNSSQNARNMHKRAKIAFIGGAPWLVNGWLNG